MNVFGPLFTLHVGSLGIPSDIVIQWVIIVILVVVGALTARKLKVANPSKFQLSLEMIYETMASLVNENMGSNYTGYVPFVGTLAIFLGILNLCGLIGFAPPTRNLSIVIGFTVITFVLIHFNAMKVKGIGGYFKSYCQPYAAMLPINLMEMIVFPVSLTLRLFGNMLAAAIIMQLVYTGLAHISWFAQLVIPILPHSFFDLFDGLIQTIIFVMLTIITIKLQAETEEA